jgi:hypothetical protein
LIAGIIFFCVACYAAFIPGSLQVQNNITLGGTVDGRDLAADGVVVDAITTNGADDLTAGEVTHQWGYLGASDQGIATTDNVTFGNIAGTLTTAAQANVTSLGVQTVFAVDDEITMLQVSTPSNPASGDNKLYFKSDDNLYTLNSAGAENQLSVGDVASTNASTIQVEIAQLDCDAGSTILDERGAWIDSIGNISGGACVITLTASVFTNNPICTANENNTGGTPVFLSVNATSATSVTVDCASDAGLACGAFNFYLQCIGE